MSLTAYLTIKGQKVGLVKGSVTQKGREDSIAVYAVQHEIASPRDAQSGLPTGKRMHKPFVITKELDKSSPVLESMLCTNENITEFKLQFWAPQIKAATGLGTEVQIYTIKLTNASIASYTLDMRLNKVEANISLPVLEVISFTYQKIEWLWNDGGIMASDDWEARV